MGGHVPRRDRSDDTNGFLLGPAFCGAAHGVGFTETAGPLKGGSDVGVVGQELQGLDHLNGVARHARCTNLGHGDVDELRQMIGQRLLKLANAVHAELNVARPIGGVERSACRHDCGLDVVGCGVGRHADDLAGRRVDVVVESAV